MIESQVYGAGLCNEHKKNNNNNLQAQVTEGPCPECTELAIPYLAIPC